MGAFLFYITAAIIVFAIAAAVSDLICCFIW